MLDLLFSTHQTLTKEIIRFGNQQEPKQPLLTK
jgi:hypothetical protein